MGLARRASSPRAGGGGSVRTTSGNASVPRSNDRLPSPVLVVLVSLCGCAEVRQSDAGDAGVIEEVRRAPELHPCNPETVAEDFWNCGACGQVCDATDA